MTNSKLLFSLLLAGSVGTASAQSLKDARAAIETENYGKAKTILQQLVSKQAKVGDNYFYLGQIYLVNDKPDSAAIMFNQGLAADPKSLINNVGLGYIDLLKKDKAAAESKFSAASANLKKKDYEELLEIGRAYIKAPEPDYAKALDYLTQAKAKNAKDAAIPLALGDAYRGLKEASSAYTSYSDAIEVDPTSIRAKIGLAVIVRGAQAFDEAVAQLTAITTESPSYAPTYRELAETYNMWSRAAGTSEEKYVELNKKGVEQYKKYLEVNGDNSLEAKIRYADFLVYARQYDELGAVSEELAKYPDVDPKIYRYLAYNAFRNKDYAKASENIQKMFTKMDPSRVIPLDNMYAGLSDIANKKTESGITYIQKAIDQDKELLAEVAETAFAKYQDQENATAVALFEIIAKYPDTDYYFDSNYYAGEGNYQIGFKKDQESKDAEANIINQELHDQALAAFVKSQAQLSIVENATKAEVLDKYLIPALYYKAFSALGTDNLENPKGDFLVPFQKLIQVINEKGVQVDKKAYLIDAYTYIGFYYYIKNDVAKAKANFEEVLKLDPENETAKSNLEGLK